MVLGKDLGLEIEAKLTFSSTPKAKKSPNNIFRLKLKKKIKNFKAQLNLSTFCKIKIIMGSVDVNCKPNPLV